MRAGGKGWSTAIAVLLASSLLSGCLSSSDPGLQPGPSQAAARRPAPAVKVVPWDGENASLPFDYCVHGMTNATFDHPSLLWFTIRTTTPLRLRPMTWGASTTGIAGISGWVAPAGGPRAPVAALVEGTDPTGSRMHNTEDLIGDNDPAHDEVRSVRAAWAERVPLRTRPALEPGRHLVFVALTPGRESDLNGLTLNASTGSSKEILTTQAGSLRFRMVCGG